MATGGIDNSLSGDSSLAGTLVPDRIFIGGISDATNEQDLITTFSRFGRIKEAKVIVNKSGVSRGYGFVTFETEEEAQRILVKFQTEGLVLKERRLNIAQAVKKKQNKDSNEIIPIQSDQFSWSNQTYLGSPSIARDIYYPRGSWAALGWPTTYVQQAYPAQAQSVSQIYPLAPADYEPPMVHSSCSTYVEACNNSEAVQNMKMPVFDGSHFVYAHSSDQVPHLPGNGSNIENPMHYMYPSSITHLNQPVFSKTLNGITVMTYPGSYEFPNPALIHAKESEHGNPIVDYGYVQCVGIPGALTPPHTPYSISPSLDCFKK